MHFAIVLIALIASVLGVCGVTSRVRNEPTPWRQHAANYMMIIGGALSVTVVVLAVLGNFWWWSVVALPAYAAVLAVTWFGHRFWWFHGLKIKSVFWRLYWHVRPKRYGRSSSLLGSLGRGWGNWR